MAPGPMDFRGGLGAAAFETGGNWLWRRFRIAAGVEGASSVPEEEDTTEDTLVCLLEVLGRRKIDPERLGRDGGGGMLPRVVPVFCAMVGLSGNFLSIK